MDTRQEPTKTVIFPISGTILTNHVSMMNENKDSLKDLPFRHDDNGLKRLPLRRLDSVLSMSVSILAEAPPDGPVQGVDVYAETARWPWR